MRQIKHSYTIKASVEKVWAALTTAELAEQWGAGPAKVDAVENGEFSYWDGGIHGTFTKIDPQRFIEQDWFEHEHPERMHHVVLTLTPDGNRTTVHLYQTDVVEDEFQYMFDGWQEYYFDPIKRLLET